MFKNFKDENDYLEAQLEKYREFKKKQKKNIPKEIIIIEWM